MNEERVFTLTLEELKRILTDAESGFKVSRGMLQYYLNTEKEDHVCTLLAEALWANFNITKILQEEFEEPILTDDGQVIIVERSLAVLQTLIASKELVNQELHKFSVSTVLN